MRRKANSNSRLRRYLMAKAREIKGLNCNASASGDVRLVLCARLDEMCGLRASALDWSDVEGVHDMRVASRRLRSALRDFKPYLRQRKIRSAADELKCVADALGAVRDQDVAIMALEELQQEAPSEVTAGIAALTDERQRERETARLALIETIEEEKLAQLQTDFANALERATAPRRHRQKKKKSPAELSFRDVGREIILARLAELRELSDCLYQPFETDALHKMRIAAKRLRYAMELFAVCWGDTLTEHAAEVAELQTSLGELHDCDVWIGGFGQMLQNSHSQSDEDKLQENETDAQQQRAAVWLLRHFAKARMKHFGNALARWSGWESSDFFTQLTASLEMLVPAAEFSPLTLTASDAVASDIEARDPS